MAPLREAIKLGTPDLQCLFPGQLVNGFVITAFLRLVERRNHFYRYLPRIWAFDSTTYSDWVRTGYAAVQNRMREAAISSQEMLILPLHLPQVGPNGHWSLIVIHLHNKTIQSYDSLHQDRRREMQKAYDLIMDAARREGLPLDIPGWSLRNTPSNCPRQEDKVSCGIYVCALADCVSRGVNVRGLTLDTREWRRKIAAALRRGRIGEESFDLREVNLALEQEVRFGRTDRRVPVDLIDLVGDDPEDHRPRATPSGEEQKTPSTSASTSGEEELRPPTTSLDPMEMMDEEKTEEASGCSPASSCLSLEAELDPEIEEATEIQAVTMPLQRIEEFPPTPSQGTSGVPVEGPVRKPVKDRLTAANPPPIYPFIGNRPPTSRKRLHGVRKRKYCRVRRWREDGTWFRENIPRPPFPENF